MWAKEAKAGALQWSVVHSEKFWREHCKKLDDNKFELLKRLIELCLSPIETVAEVACYDLGEYARFHPQGIRFGGLTAQADIIHLPPPTPAGSIVIVKARQQSGCGRARATTEIDNAGRIEADDLEALQHARSHFPVQGVTPAKARGRAREVALDGAPIGEKRFGDDIGRTIHLFNRGTRLGKHRAKRLTDNQAIAA
jgi:hypothetical protein